jgi:hypothetical protein
MRRRLGRAGLFGVVVVLPLSAAAAAGTNRHLTPTSTVTTLPCVDVTIPITQPPPWIYVCPLAAQSD